jgi:hypothetical protein
LLRDHEGETEIHLSPVSTTTAIITVSFTIDHATQAASHTTADQPSSNLLAKSFVL